MEFNNQIIQSDHTNNLIDNEVTMQEWDWTPLQMFPLYNTTAFNQIISYLQETDTVTISYLNHVIKLINNSEQIINAQPLTTNADWVFMEYGIFLALMIVITAILFILHELFGISRYHSQIQEHLSNFSIYVEYAIMYLRQTFYPKHFPEDTTEEDTEMQTNYYPNYI